MELDAAIQKYLAQQQAMRTVGDGADKFSQSSNMERLAALIEENNFANRSLQFQAKLETSIRELTTEDVDAALRKYIDPKKLVIVYSAKQGG